jgi:hypothetical protein
VPAGLLATAQQQLAERPGDRGKEHVVDGSAELPVDGFDVGKRRAGDAIAARPPDRAGQRGDPDRHQGAGQRHQPVRGVGGAAEELLGGAQRAAHLAVVRPTFMAGAPRIFEKIQHRVMAMAGGGIKRRIFDWALKVGRRAATLRRAGKQPSRLLKLQHAVADRLVFARLRRRFGGRLRFFVSGSAAPATSASWTTRGSCGSPTASRT